MKYTGLPTSCRPLRPWGGQFANILCPRLLKSITLTFQIANIQWVIVTLQWHWKRHCSPFCMLLQVAIHVQNANRNKRWKWNQNYSEISKCGHVTWMFLSWCLFWFGCKLFSQLRCTHISPPMRYSHFSPPDVEISHHSWNEHISYHSWDAQTSHSVEMYTYPTTHEMFIFLTTHEMYTFPTTHDIYTYLISHEIFHYLCSFISLF